MERGYTFDEKSAKAIEKVVLHVLASQQPRRQPPYKRRPSGGGTTVAGGGVALFFMPAGQTIPGLEGSTAGSLELDRATIDDQGAVATTGESDTVWNTSKIAIHATGDVWLKAIEVNGQWVALSHELELADRYGIEDRQVLGRCEDGDPTWQAGSPLVSLDAVADSPCQWKIRSVNTCGDSDDTAAFGLGDIDIVSRVYCESGQIKYDTVSCSAAAQATATLTTRPDFLPASRPAFG